MAEKTQEQPTNTGEVLLFGKASQADKPLVFVMTAKAIQRGNRAEVREANPIHFLTAQGGYLWKFYEATPTEGKKVIRVGKEYLPISRASFLVDMCAIVECVKSQADILGNDYFARIVKSEKGNVLIYPKPESVGLTSRQA